MTTGTRTSSTLDVLLEQADPHYFSKRMEIHVAMGFVLAKLTNGNTGATQSHLFTGTAFDNLKSLNSSALSSEQRKDIQALLVDSGCSQSLVAEFMGITRAATNHIIKKIRMTRDEKLKSDDFVILEITEREQDFSRLFLHHRGIKLNEHKDMLVALFKRYNLELAPKVQVDELLYELAITNQPMKVYRFITIEKRFFANVDKKFFGNDDFVEVLQKLARG